MRPSEAGHWYDKQGKPAYEVAAKNGEMRAATLRDARKLNLLPSVTTIIMAAASPGLERWKIDQAIMAALTLPRVEGESNTVLIERIKADAQEQAKKAREKGTAIHAAIQGHYEGEQPSEEYWPYVKAGKERVDGWSIERSEWIAERSFAHPLGFGGKVDLSCHPGAVLDFKTKEFDEDGFADLKIWDDHMMQLAAYREGLGRPTARCAIVYVSSSVPGLAKLIELDEAELAKGWDMFQGLLIYWMAKTGYRPA